MEFAIVPGVRGGGVRSRRGGPGVGYARFAGAVAFRIGMHLGCISGARGSPRARARSARGTVGPTGRLGIAPGRPRHQRPAPRASATSRRRHGTEPCRAGSPRGHDRRFGLVLIANPPCNAPWDAYRGCRLVDYWSPMPTRRARAGPGRELTAHAEHPSRICSRGAYANRRVSPWRNVHIGGWASPGGRHPTPHATRARLPRPPTMTA